MSWLDVVLGVLLLVTLVWGIVKGLVKQVIGVAAVVVGLVLAAFNYRRAAGMFRKLMDNETLANFLGFILIFAAVLAAGALLGYLMTKAMVGPLALGNRLLGGAFGLLKGVLVCGVVIFALLAFDIERPALESSRLAPLCFGVTRAAVNLIPRDLKDMFDSSYKEIKERGGRHGQKI
ncbi:MAG: CvpA family protein [Candidatus Aminicenantes bacterium]|nr:CvpA family protein [Candidatus Aminicenantes bacterium]